jgi:hypothetical protein
MGTAATSTASYADACQAAQREYCDTMKGLWQQVCAGRLSEGEYWQAANGEPLAACLARLRAATAEWDTGHPQPPVPGILRLIFWPY